MQTKAQGQARDPRGFGRWLRFCACAALRLLRGEDLAGRLLWTQDAAAELLACGFPGLLAVPERLFAQTAALFPERCRLAAARRGEKELLEAIRFVERRCGARFDWDRFLARCERESRRARRIGALAEGLRALAPPPIDTRTPQTALRSLSENR
ncbi:MAG: 2-hydroxyacyl-CoA dehydratase [Oscillospiraceae bacterium]|nr:2-hydroxyacyl-CoA dehydratase [Oscillospiraceae bacterium]